MQSVFSPDAAKDRIGRARVDPRIAYPCYKSFDDFIVVERLCALDGYITARIERHIRTQEDDYFVNQHRLDESLPFRPGVREIWLSRTAPGVPYHYQDLNRCELWRPTAAAEEFALLMDFIGTLPFAETGRMLVIYDYEAQAVPPHRDHTETDVCHEFVWLRTNLKKPFYMLDHETGAKKYVEGYSAWFDSVNQFHGSDGCDGLSFSIRVDGKFTEDFRAQIPRPVCNPASTPALWACI